MASTLSIPLPPKYVAPPRPAPATTASPSNFYDRILAWKERLRKAYEAPHVSLYLAEQALRIDKEDAELLKSESYRKAIGEMEVEWYSQVFHLMDRELKDALLYGDYIPVVSKTRKWPVQLTESLADDAATWTAKETLADRRPIIYMHFHVDDNDQTPSIRGYKLIADTLQPYLDYCTALSKKRHGRASDRQVVEQIDTAVKAPSTDKKTRNDWVFDSARPRYADTGNAKPNISDPLLTGLRQWIAFRTEEWRQTPQNQRHCLTSHPVCETGWTVRPNARRWEQFEHGAGGNKLMNLIDAATRVVFPTRTYRMRYIIVLETISSDLATPGECAISRISSSYTTCGGVNHTEAGISVRGSYEMKAKVYTANMAALNQKLEASMQHDYNIVGDKLKEAKEAKESVDLRKELEDKDQKAKELEQELDGLMQEEMELGKQLDKEADAYSKLVNEEEKYAQLQKKLGDLAVSANGLFRAA